MHKCEGILEFLWEVALVFWVLSYLPSLSSCIQLFSVPSVQCDGSISVHAQMSLNTVES